MERTGVIWTRQLDKPVKLADMVLTAMELQITRHPDGMSEPGFSMLHDLAGENCWQWPCSYQQLPPQLQALLPPQDPYAPMRRLMHNLLDARGIERRGRMPIEQEWLLLTQFGAGGIGHLDVFADDHSAARYYAQPRPVLQALPAAEVIWSCLRDGKVNPGPDELCAITANMQLSGAPGMIPKLFTNDPATGHQVLIKVEPTDYPRVLALEALALELHCKAGLAVPDWQYREVPFGDHVLPILILKRFDRDAAGQPLPQESFYTLLRTNDPRNYVSRTDGAMETLFAVADKPSLLANPYAAKLGIYQRFVMSLLTGNGDLHSDNFALIGRAGDAELAPVFDPAPMRAYRRFNRNHDILSALPFTGIGGIDRLNREGMPEPYSSTGALPPDLRERLLALAANAGIRPADATAWIANALAVTTDFADAACDLLSLAPETDRKQKRPDVDGFRKTVLEIRAALMRSV